MPQPESYPLSRTLLKRARGPSALFGPERARGGLSWAPASASRSRRSPSPERPWRSQYRSQNARKRDAEKGSISRASNRTRNGIGSASTASSYPAASAFTLPTPGSAPAASRRPVPGRRARAELDVMAAQSAELKSQRSQPAKIERTRSRFYETAYSPSAARVRRLASVFTGKASERPASCRSP